jgi:2-polyprenyl-6-methoxyphenol hydroxylase-like FAD-dependent oxidoreductase
MGAGVCGLAAALMLARDGHDVTVIERDKADPPSTPNDAWEEWDRKGVAQFRQPHNLHARARHILGAELPDVLDALGAAGAYRMDPIANLPPFITDRTPRPDDDKFWTLTGRRPMVELVFARAARKEPRVDILRGERVLRLAVGTSVIPDVPHVIGVETETHGTIQADLVIDAMGRQSKLPEWIVAVGGKRPYEEAEDCRFTYYTRYFRSRDGELPRPVAPLLSEFPTYSVLTLPADNSHWSVTVFTSNADAPMKRLRDESCWTKLVDAHPLHRHWMDGEAITDVLPIAGIMDRYRRFVIDDVPVITGVLAVADAWACTNPSAGRGISVGLMHAVQLRDVVRAHLHSPGKLAAVWDEVTEHEVAPWYRLQVKADRARVAAIDAAREGRAAAPPQDETANLMRSLGAAAPSDPDAFRAMMELIVCLALPNEIFARAGFKEHVLQAAKDKQPVGLPGPPREQLVALLA